MVKKEVTNQDILQALHEIDKSGVPKRRQAIKYNLYHDGKSYPPKYVLSLATKYATGKELEATDFSGGDETNNFLSSLGFTIREGSNEVKKK